MNQRELYLLFNAEGKEGNQARELLYQRHWFTRIAEFDPRTGDALPLGFDDVVRRLVLEDDQRVLRDRLWRITDHSRAAIKRIISSLSNSPKRDQAVLPIRSVRELNAASFIALSRRPGRNIREKLGDRPYMQAVRRYQSIDLPENRLFKAYLTQLVELLELRTACIGEQDELITDIHRWLKSDLASEISQWQNLAANNTLLSHRDYRRVWDAWRWLQKLDDDLAKDIQALEQRRELIEAWDGFVLKFSQAKTLFGSMPVLFDYESFSIETWCAPIQIETNDIDRTVFEKQKFTGAVCVDLARARPIFATQESLNASELREQFVWQYWQRDSQATSIELFDADLVVEHPDAVTVSSKDLFFGGTSELTTLDAAARSFSQKLNTIFTSPTLQWLYPDHLNDFELGLLRRNLNSRFAGAEPLPRSIAAVFEAIDYSRIGGDGFQVVVYDEFDGVVFATRLIARFDSELLARLPITNGYYWERTPTIVLEMASDDGVSGRGYVSVDQSGQVRNGSSVLTRSELREAPGRYRDIVGHSDIQMIVNGSPVQGGVRLRSLQLQAVEIPLWRDQIPELSIKAIVNGLWEAIPLVGAHTSVRPIRGQEVEIPIPKGSHAPLGPGVPKFDFPLFQGRSDNKIGFEAFLSSPSFPLSSLTQFRMKLTYTYGADDPYKLQFIAIGKDGKRDPTIQPIVATWRPIAKSTESELENLPLPDLGEKAQWHQFTNWPSIRPDPRTGANTWNFFTVIQQVLADLASTESRLKKITASRVVGNIKTKGLNDNGQVFLFVDVNGEDVYCNEHEFLGTVSDSQLTPGDRVFLNIEKKNGRTRGLNVTFGQNQTQLVETKQYDYIRRRLNGASFPSHMVWNRGRSITEIDCPAEFKIAVERGRETAQRLYDNESTPKSLRNDLLVFLSRMHKDAPSETIRNIELLAGQTRLNQLELQCIAWSIGDCSESWQERILYRVLQPDFPGTIYVLSIAFLKCPQIVENLGYNEVVQILYQLEDELTSQLQSPPSKGSIRRCTYAFEVLLALLYTRSSEDIETKRLLAPEEYFGVVFKDMIDDVARILRDYQLTLRSRVEMRADTKAIDEKWQPDLLVALRRTLTGSDDATALRISWASESGSDG